MLSPFINSSEKTGQSEKPFRRENIRFINMKHIGNSYYILSSCNLYRPVLVLLCKIDKRTTHIEKEYQTYNGHQCTHHSKMTFSYQIVFTHRNFFL